MWNDVNRCRNLRVSVLHGFPCWIIWCKHWRQLVANSWDKELCRAVEGLPDLRWRRGEGISKSPNLGMIPELNLQELCTWCVLAKATAWQDLILLFWWYEYFGLLDIISKMLRLLQYISVQFQPFWPSVYDRHRLSSAWHRVFSHVHHHVSPLIKVLCRLSLVAVSAASGWCSVLVLLIAAQLQPSHGESSDRRSFVLSDTGTRQSHA